MKHLFKLTLLLLPLLLPATATAHDFEVDGIYYNINGNEATVTSGTSKYTGDVTIPDSVTHDGTTYLVTAIGWGAFGGCDGLKSIATGNSVKLIDALAFTLCENLASVTIGNSVKQIWYNAFSSCPNLTSFIVASENTRYDSRNNCNAIIETARNILIAGCQNTVIPNSVIAIGSSAFYGRSRLTGIDIPSSITIIGMEAFAGCSSLTSMTIPSSVTAIGQLAFAGCNAMTSIIVESGNTRYDSRNNCNAIIETESNSLIAGCQNTEIPVSVTSIGDYAFYECSSLTGVTIPSSVTAIGEDAFMRCEGLTSMTIPNTVTSIGQGAFAECSGLTSVNIPNSITKINNSLFRMCSSLASVTIPNTLTSIGDYAFYECSSLTSVTIPNLVTSIGKWAFRDCNGLTDVYSFISDISKVTIGGSTFYLSDKNYSGRTLHVPYGAADDYQANENWYSYFGSIVEMDQVPGDVNGDGEVNIADVNAVINMILGGNNDTTAADVNGDGEINIADVNSIINIILSGAEN